MKERTCNVLLFLSCTTAPTRRFSCASITTPCTMRSLSSSLSFLSNDKTADAKQVRNKLATIALRVTLNSPFTVTTSPPIFLLFFFVVAGVAVFLLFVLQVILGLQFQRADACDFQIGATLVAAQRIAFIDVTFIHIDFGVAFRAKHHMNPSHNP